MAFAWEPLHLLVLFRLPISCHFINLVNFISMSSSPAHQGKYLILVKMTPAGGSPGQSYYVCCSLPAALEGPAGSFQPKVLCYLASSLFFRTLEVPSLVLGQAHHAIPLGDATGLGSGRDVWPQG